MSRGPLRILFIPRESYPTDRVRINVLFGRELLSRGHQIDLAMQAASGEMTRGIHDWFGRAVFVGPTDSGTGVFNRLHKHWLGFRHDFNMLRLARPARYDALLVSDKFVLAAIAAPLARRHGLKFIFWLTFPYPEADLLGARERTARYPWLMRIRGSLSGLLLYKWILPRSDHVFVQSDRMKLDICAHGIAPAKVSPIVTGFDLSGIAPVPVVSNAEPSRPVVLAYLGTLHADRHLDILVEMMADLGQSGMNAKLLLIGDSDRPQDKAMLWRRAAELGVSDKMEISGFLPQQTAWMRMQEADICLSPIYPAPTLMQGSPTKLVEYLALGRPVVANDQPEQRMILRESRAGVRVPWGAKHFARAVRWLMQRSHAERAAMGARGRAWVEANRTYARIADEVERTCSALLSSDAASRETKGSLVGRAE